VAATKFSKYGGKVRMRQFSLCCAVALAAISDFSAGAHGSPTFTYEWAAGLAGISSDQGKNLLLFTYVPPITVTTSQVVGKASSISLQNANSDTFTNRYFDLGVQITDGSKSGGVDFNGVFNGTVTNGVPTTLTATYTTPTTQSLTLGADHFTVKLTGFVSPTSFGAANNPGGFDFEIDAATGLNSPPPPNDVPEPTTLLLSCLGVGGFAIRAWRRRTN
jgi:hypothetical protein